MYNIDEYLNNEEELENNSNSFLQEWKELPLIKIEKLLNYIRVLETQNNSIKEEVERMKTLQKSNEKKIDNIKNFICFLMGDKPLNVGTYKISKRNTEAVEILDETKVPQKFKEKKITYTISKTKIKNYLNKDVINEETGEVEKINCDWARIKKNVSLQIK